MTDIELYNAAKEAYYSGKPIMEDFEFDELEKKLGLENNAHIGTRHNPAYTVEHPFIMGSLSKVQIKKDAFGNIDWNDRYEAVLKYAAFGSNVIVTPKYDGCSFEAVLNAGNILSVSTRGDGHWGKDISKHIGKHVNAALHDVRCDGVFRGEVLVKKSVFNSKYSEFVNPRSFVAGVLNRDWEPDMEAVTDDLDIVIYDTRIDRGFTYEDKDWTVFNETGSFSGGSIPKQFLPGFHMTGQFTEDTFVQMYRRFEQYRNDECEYALDGFVIKPIAPLRIQNFTEERPFDCVAIKFVPQLQETEVVSIEWDTKKTDELRPVIEVKPVIMDGKTVTKASAHNYGYMIDNRISVGTKLVLSLAGDIIPFIYKITDSSAFSEDKMMIPEGIATAVDGCHLRKVMNPEEMNRNRFINSAAVLNIPGIGPAVAERIYEALDSSEDACAEFFGEEAVKKEAPDSILKLQSVEIENALGGKLGHNAKREYDKVLKELSLKDIIKSCCFRLCGDTASEAVAKYIAYGEADFTSIPAVAYEWASDKDSPEWKRLSSILEYMNKTVEDFKKVIVISSKDSDAVPVILTGEPNTCASKGEFLKLHPEYRLTTSWKEVKIVFTNSMESETGKMKKAREKGIEIRLY